MYRPGPYLALAIMVVPVAVTLGAAALALNATGAIPVWLPFLLLLWIPCLPAVWLTMQTVRTDALIIAAGRPWRPLQEIPWAAVERVERRGKMITISSGAVRISYLPMLLRDGNRLTRDLLMRLPGHVLVGSLSLEAQRIVAPSIYRLPEGGLSGTLAARPLRRLRALMALIGGLALAGGIAAVLWLPAAAGIPCAVIAACLVAAAVVCFLWLGQTILVNEKGVSVVWALPHRTQSVPWAEVQLVEHSTGEALLRFRPQRIRCAGPTLFSRAQRDLMRAFLHEYCTSRSVPIVRRRWLF